MASKRRNIFYENKKQETTGIVSILDVRFNPQSYCPGPDFMKNSNPSTPNLKLTPISRCDIFRSECQCAPLVNMLTSYYLRSISFHKLTMDLPLHAVDYGCETSCEAPATNEGLLATNRRSPQRSIVKVPQFIVGDVASNREGRGANRKGLEQLVDYGCETSCEAPATNEGLPATNRRSPQRSIVKVPQFIVGDVASNREGRGANRKGLEQLVDYGCETSCEAPATNEGLPATNRRSPQRSIVKVPQFIVGDVASNREGRGANRKGLEQLVDYGCETSCEAPATNEGLPATNRRSPQRSIVKVPQFIVGDVASYREGRGANRKGLEQLVDYGCETSCEAPATNEGLPATNRRSPQRSIVKVPQFIVGDVASYREGRGANRKGLEQLVDYGCETSCEAPATNEGLPATNRRSPQRSIVKVPQFIVGDVASYREGRGANRKGLEQLVDYGCETSCEAPATNEGLPATNRRSPQRSIVKVPQFIVGDVASYREGRGANRKGLEQLVDYGCETSCEAPATDEGLLATNSQHCSSGQLVHLLLRLYLFNFLVDLIM
ncbi:hypothetical protein AAG570_012349 [Ranatra chinensis]|uniref:Uncharacterized protein n=1 Tax=Ranatra chinensis TaxID=642074 RepID=A0ABD0YUV2_9HEMI